MSANCNPYLALGVRPFINCCSVRTLHGGSLMLPPVQAAMAEASRWFVNLDELMEAAGRRLAELTGAEGGIVTCGSAAAVALGTAACVAGNDPVKMLRLPFTDGMVNRVIIPRTQRFAYDQAVRMIGCHIVEIDTRKDVERALEEPVALVVLLGKQEHLCPVRLEEFASIMRPCGIPILVDAASEHLERPIPWLARGADLVVYSGGKFLRGPQTSGLLLGAKRLVEAAWRNASPHQALGRPMKVSKEDIIGVLTAVEYWFEERDHAAERRIWHDDIAIIAERVGRLPAADSEVVEPAGVDLVPRLRLLWDTARYPIDGLELRRQALAGEPRIMLDDNSATANSIEIDPFQLQPGEAAQIGEAVAAILDRSRSAAGKSVSPSVIDIGGEWELRIDFLHGARVHRLTLEQQGAHLVGHQRSSGFDGPVEGALHGDMVQLSFTTCYEGSTISYLFDGAAHGGQMSGTAALGAASAQNAGVVNKSQFGAGRWSARRVA
ncbi:MAG: aminotransferase class V-fold PLP-dependent enzyme [Alphaproteobacteria bacterium]|nr:aminotransferase class V-fold PLP-dependent enzyme [Alphaproteobacteria bacterium]